MRSARRLVGFDQRQQLIKQIAGGLAHAGGQCARGVGNVNLHLALANDVARVGLVAHVMQRHASFSFAIHKHPINRATAAILGQHGRVQINATLWK